MKKITFFVLFNILIISFLIHSCKFGSENIATNPIDSALQIIHKSNGKETFKKTIKEKEYKFIITGFGETNLVKFTIKAERYDTAMIEIQEKDVKGNIDIVDVRDLNGNKYPELYIVTKDEADKEQLFAYEFNDKDWSRIFLPKPKLEKMNGYLGNGQYKFKKDKLIHYSPVFNPDSTPANREKVVEFSLSDSLIFTTVTK